MADKTKKETLKTNKNEVKTAVNVTGAGNPVQQEVNKSKINIDSVGHMFVGSPVARKLRNDGAINIPVELRQRHKLVPGKSGLEWKSLSNGDLVLTRTVCACTCCQHIFSDLSQLSSVLGMCKECEDELESWMLTATVPDYARTISTGRFASGSVIDYLIKHLKAYKNPVKVKKEVQRKSK